MGGGGGPGAVVFGSTEEGDQLGLGPEIGELTVEGVLNGRVASACTNMRSVLARGHS